MARPSKYNREFRERAVRLVLVLVLVQRGECPSEFEAIMSISVKLGSARLGSAETLRKVGSPR